MVAALCLVGLVLGMVTPVGQAAVNEDIRLSNLRLTHIDDRENPLPGRLTAGSSLALLTYDWDARSADLKAGDSFSIALPEEFQYRVMTTHVFLFDYGEGDKPVGSCRVAARLMTCTFDETLENKIAEGFTGVAGTGKVHLSTVGATSAETVDMVLNGVETATVDLPGTGGIGTSAIRYAPVDLGKGATGISGQSRSVTWVVRFDPTLLSRAYASAGRDVTFDGVTPQTVTMTDTLGPGQLCPTASAVSLNRMNSAAVPSTADHRLLLDGGAAGATTTEAGTFEVTLTCGETTAEGTPMTITLTGPFVPDTTYQVGYAAAVDTATGYALAGYGYQNTVSVEGTDLTRSATKSYADSFGMVVNMQPGFGTFRAVKYVQGPGSGGVAPDASFTLTVDYELPAGTVASDYAGWTAPGTLNADGRTGTATVTVAMGKQTTFTGPNPSTTFPAGTTVTLTEQTPTVALPAGYTWGTPVFTVANRPTNTLTVGDQAITAVDVTNDVEAAERGSFELVKTVTGIDGANKDYTFTYACDDGQSGTLVVKGDGVAVPAGTTFPAGTRCTLDEDLAAAAVDGYDLAAPGTRTFTVPAGPQVETVVVDNAYTRHTGTFAVMKTVTGDDLPAGPGPVNVPEKVTVSYSCDDADGTSGTLEVPTDGSAVSGPTLPTGTTCTISEDADSAAREGYALATSYSATQVTVVKDSVTAVTVTNHYTRLTGGFTLSKTVDGTGADLSPEEFTFSYTCTDAVTGADSGPTQVSVEAGRSVTVTDVPTGTCTITEADASVDGADLVTSLTVDGVPVHGESATIEVDEDSAVAVSATNTYTRHTGTFMVTKVVTGDLAPNQLPPGLDSVSVSYTCDDPAGRSGVLQVPVDGSAVSSPELPVGVTCSLSEDEGSAAVQGYTVATSYSDAQVTIVKDSVPTVTVTNDYTRVPAPADTPTAVPTDPGGAATRVADPAAAASTAPDPAAAAAAGTGRPGSSLATTGASAGATLTLTALGTLLGGVVLLAHRRRG